MHHLIFGPKVSVLQANVRVQSGQMSCNGIKSSQLHFTTHHILQYHIPLIHHKPEELLYLPVMYVRKAQ